MRTSFFHCCNAQAFWMRSRTKTQSFFVFHIVFTHHSTWHWKVCKVMRMKRVIYFSIKKFHKFFNQLQVHRWYYVFCVLCSMLCMLLSPIYLPSFFLLPKLKSSSFEYFLQVFINLFHCGSSRLQQGLLWPTHFSFYYLLQWHHFQLLMNSSANVLGSN